MADHSINDSDFIKLLQQRHAGAFEQLYNSYAPSLFGFINQSVHVPQIGEMLLENVFMYIYHHIHMYDAGKNRLFSWILSITRNECAEYHLQNSESKENLVGISSDVTNSDLRSADQIYNDFVHAEIGSYGPTTQAIMKLIFVYGSNYGEAARQLQIPEEMLTRHVAIIVEKTKLSKR